MKVKGLCQYEEKRHRRTFRRASTVSLAVGFIEITTALGTMVARAYM